MKQTEVFNRIGSIIKELNDQYEYLQTTPENLNDLELELFVSNAHFLASHVEILCKLNLQNSKSSTVKQLPFKTQDTQEQKYFEPVVQQIEHGVVDESNASATPLENEVSKNDAVEEQPAPQINLGAGSSPDSYSYSREEPQIIRHELILDETLDWDEDEIMPVDTEAVRNFKKRIADMHPASGPIAQPHKFVPPNSGDNTAAVKKNEEPVTTINQKILSQSGDKATSKTDQLSIKPITDIKLAITLNDKLLYVKDLFNGYNLAYSEVIEILNRFSSFEEAIRFLKTNYVTKNNWESKPATVEKFYDLLKRRYT